MVMLRMRIRIERRMQTLMMLLISLLLLEGCGGEKDSGRGPADLEAEVIKDAGGISDHLKKIVSGEHGDMDSDDFDRESVYAPIRELATKENSVMVTDSYNGTTFVVGMTAEVSDRDILRGSPIVYEKFQIDGWIFEWLISDYENEEKQRLEDGVLVVSREQDAEDIQILPVTAEGGDSPCRVSKENLFVYADVNFDDIPDLLICTGHHGNQGLLTYYCFLQTESGFVESPSFTDIPNPAIDTERQLILSRWRNSAVSHSWAEFECRNDTFIMKRELESYAEIVDRDTGEEVWIWKVNGEVIGRSDELSESEIEDLIYNENSEWGIAGSRWRSWGMLYFTEAV